MLSLAQQSAILHDAPKVFSRMFNQLMLGCFISQSELARKATATRQSLIDDNVIARGDKLIGSQAQQTIDNVTDGDQRPTHGQLRIWLDAIADWCEDSPAMLAKIAKIGVSKPRYPREIERDLYRLALFGTFDEIKKAYEKWKDLSLLEYLEEMRHYQYEQAKFPAYPNTDEIPSFSSSLDHRQAGDGDDAEIIKRIREREAQH
jgi:hypothetical protein